MKKPPVKTVCALNDLIRVANYLKAIFENPERYDDDSCEYAAIEVLDYMDELQSILEKKGKKS